MSDEQDNGIKVTDRRIHSEPSDAPETEEAQTAEEPAQPDEPAAEPDESAAEPDTGAAEAADDAFQAGADAFPMTFATFVVSLGESAWMHLGLVPHPVTGELRKDLVAARQTIDILGILEEKTKGNLEDEEEKLLTNLLYSLRIQCVQAQTGTTE